MDLDAGLEHIANQIAESLVTQETRKIAIGSFKTLTGEESDFGRFVAEELTTRLFLGQSFQVVERQLLQQIIEEHKLFAEGIIDPASARELGRISGAGAILMGTVTDLGESVKINARLISTESGMVFAVAAAGIDKDPTVTRLMSGNQAGTSRPPRERGGRQTPLAAGCGSAPPGYFIHEDFRSVETGRIPEGWVGGNRLLVKNNGGVKELTNFETANDLFVRTCPVDFPRDFELTISFWWDYGSIKISCGSIPILIRDVGSIHIGKTELWVKRRLEKQLHLLTVRRNGDVFVFLLDSQEIHVGRYPGASMRTIEFTNANVPYPTHHFGVRSIMGRTN